ncbi:structure specific recognition protein 1 [Planoprotostelium fungivorum]|uniref:Structure specific recognition protein 1 n=1 Tax=Planoprotostelium fungivorum TaxID=1890364 RepID=A0A2P6NRN2_9EUKA|nr:structure specific recognition protein 1 [Planoprotostelium fungivorum]
MAWLTKQLCRISITDIGENEHNLTTNDLQHNGGLTDILLSSYRERHKKRSRTQNHSGRCKVIQVVQAKVQPTLAFNRNRTKSPSGPNSGHREDGEEVFNGSRWTFAFWFHSFPHTQRGNTNAKTKKKKDPAKPKRAMSSFMFFANEKRPEVREANPGMKITDVGKRLGELWKETSAEERKKYELMSSRDSERYQEELKSYVPPPEEDNSDSDSSSGKKRRKRVKKDPNQPKRPTTSFMFFANEKRPEFKEKFPKLKMTELTAKLSEAWKAITPTEKQTFIDKAQKDTVRYNEAKKAYEEGRAAPVAAPAADSDDGASSSDGSDDE